LSDVFSALNRQKLDYEYWYFACRVASGLRSQPTDLYKKIIDYQFATQSAGSSRSVE
jgi:hypothetical protein